VCRQFSNTRTALHLAICGSPEFYEGRGQIHFLDWALTCVMPSSKVRPTVPVVAAAEGV